MEKKILPPLLPGFELATFPWRVRRFYQQAIPYLPDIQRSVTTMIIIPPPPSPGGKVTNKHILKSGLHFKVHDTLRLKETGWCGWGWSLRKRGGQTLVNLNLSGAECLRGPNKRLNLSGILTYPVFVVIVICCFLLLLFWPPPPKKKKKRFWPGLDNHLNLSNIWT